MPRITETRTLQWSAEQMFDLVADVRRYAEFLPWVVATRIKSDSEGEMIADMLVGFSALREKFTSRVVKDRPRSIKVEYIDGPLKRLENDKLIQRWTMGSDADTRVGLTRRGEELLAETEQFVRSFRSSVLDRFGVQHHVALRALLVSLDEVLETARRRPDFIDD